MFIHLKVIFIPFQNSPEGVKWKSENDFCVENIKIISIKSIDRTSHYDMRKFYLCLQETILFRCEDNWNEIAESRKKEFADVDTIFLWMSEKLFKHNTGFIPTIQMEICEYDCENGNRRRSLKRMKI